MESLSAVEGSLLAFHFHSSNSLLFLSFFLWLVELANCFLSIYLLRKEKGAVFVFDDVFFAQSVVGLLYSALMSPSPTTIVPISCYFFCLSSPVLLGGGRRYPE